MVQMPVAQSVLTDELLICCHDRSTRVDRLGAGMADDIDDLRQTGFLQLPLPVEFGGTGLALSQVALELQRLAYYAAHTADAVAMHLASIGVAADLWRAGDRSLQWLLEDAARGLVFTAAHSEPGNDTALLTPMMRAERVDGGYRFTGHKLTGASGSDWSYLSLHALQGAEYAPGTTSTPHIVHAFLPRNTEGYVVRGARESGMPAGTNVPADVLLDGAFVPDRFVARTIPITTAATDAFSLALLAWHLLLQAHVAGARARRAFDLTVDALHRTVSVRQAQPMAHDPVVQHHVARMGLVLEGLDPHLESLSRQWSRGPRHGALWPIKLLAARQHAMDGARDILDLALELIGGPAVTRRSELDALSHGVRLARLQPVSPAATLSLIGRGVLGLPMLGTSD